MFLFLFSNFILKNVLFHFLRIKNFLDQLAFLHFKISIFKNIHVPIPLILELPVFHYLGTIKIKKESTDSFNFIFFILFNRVMIFANKILISYISSRSFSNRLIRVLNPSFKFFSLSSDHSLFLYSISLWKLFKNT